MAKEKNIRHYVASLLDSDLYKYSMQMMVVKHFNTVKVRYDFFNRGKTIFPMGFGVRLNKLVQEMQYLFLEKEEAEYLHTLPFLTPFYIEYLKSYNFDPSEVQIYQSTEGELMITIEGYWFRTILWEVPLMALISQLYFEMTGLDIDSEEDRTRTNVDKALFFRNNGIFYADYGTRRRYSLQNHEKVLKDLIEYSSPTPQNPHGLVGTSNVYLALKYGIKPIGTLAHEVISVIAALEGYQEANKKTMDYWSDVYGGALGTMLTDTYTTPQFFKEFCMKYAKLFDSIRHDSGDPVEFGELAIAHYKSLDIDTMSKTLIFSDNLNTEKVLEIAKHFKGRIKFAFGIGTFLSNDVGVKALNMVIKATKADGKHVIKLSDDLSKNTGDLKTVLLVKELLSL